jgi:hypothetical protein
LDEDVSSFVFCKVESLIVEEAKEEGELGGKLKYLINNCVCNTNICN